MKFMAWKERRLDDDMKTSRLVHYLSPVLSSCKWIMSGHPWRKVQCLHFIGKPEKMTQELVFENSSDWTFRLQLEVAQFVAKRKLFKLTSSISQQINVIVSTAADAVVVAIATFHCGVEFVRRRSQHDLPTCCLNSLALESFRLWPRGCVALWPFSNHFLIGVLYTWQPFTLPEGADRAFVTGPICKCLSLEWPSTHLIAFFSSCLINSQLEHKSLHTNWKWMALSERNSKKNRKKRDEKWIFFRSEH